MVYAIAKMAKPKIRLVSSTALCYHENIMNF